MLHRITLLPQKQNIQAPAGQTLLDALRYAGCFVATTCDGSGTCGKCKVIADGKEVLACQTVVDRDMTVDIGTGTTDVVCRNGQIDENGAEEAYWCEKAFSLGFSYAVPMDPARLVAREDVRGMCAADKCGAYGKNWTCPPHCGTLESCQKQLQGYTRGILVQTVGTMKKTIDSKAYRETEKRHLQQFYALAQAIRTQYPQALCLGSGGCRICGKCAFPEACRFPEKACSSMEAYGLFVTEVCRDNGLAYHHGEKTVTYTACVLF